MNMACLCPSIPFTCGDIFMINGSLESFKNDCGVWKRYVRKIIQHAYRIKTMLSGWAFNSICCWSYVRKHLLLTKRKVVFGYITRNEIIFRLYWSEKLEMGLSDFKKKKCATPLMVSASTSCLVTCLEGVAQFALITNRTHVKLYWNSNWPHLKYKITLTVRRYSK